jgi:fatty acid-binding protein DegV
MLELVHTACDGKTIEQVAILHANCPEKALHFQSSVLPIAPAREPYFLAEISPGLSIHTGLGTIGLSVLTSE